VVLHDPDVGGSTDGEGLVHTLTLREVKRLDASGGIGPPQRIPTLVEALSVIGAHPGLGVDLEIKNIPGEPGFDSPREAVLEAALAALNASAFRGPTLVSSFNWVTLERSKQLAPHIPTGFLTAAAIDPRSALAHVKEGGHQFVLPQVGALLEAGEGFIEEAHADGISVGTWTVDDEAILGKLFSWRVDAVASNDPRAAVRVRNRVASVEE
jgi:glycerophosphoryl diester phosphodiesterase